MENQPLTIEKVYSYPVAKVWNALTDKNEMRKWYFNVSDFKPEPGFEFHFEAGDERETYMHHCKVTEVKPYRKIAYRWRYEGYEGNSVVAFELFEENNNTRLKLTHEGIKTFPAHLSDFKKASFEKGWSYLINDALEKYLKTSANVN